MKPGEIRKTEMLLGDDVISVIEVFSGRPWPKYEVREVLHGRSTLWSSQRNRNGLTWILMGLRSQGEEEENWALVGFASPSFYKRIILIEELAPGNRDFILVKGRTPAKKAVFERELRRFLLEKKRAHLAAKAQATEELKRRREEAAAEEERRRQEVRQKERLTQKQAEEEKKIQSALQRSRRLEEILSRPIVPFWDAATGQRFFGRPVKDNEWAMLENHAFVVLVDENSQPREARVVKKTKGGRSNLEIFSFPVVFALPDNASAQTEKKRPVQLNAIWLEKRNGRIISLPFLSLNMLKDKETISRLEGCQVAVDHPTKDGYPVYLIQAGQLVFQFHLLKARRADVKSNQQ